MRSVLTTTFFAGLAMVAAACSSGSGDDPASLRIRCNGGQAFCIISCDLGCTQNGCAVSEIAENQTLRFKFSDRVDASSVNGASLSIRTAAGVAPDGDLVAQGSEVVFIPRVRTVAGVSTFGFLRNESYIITLAGGSTGAQGIRSITGDRLSQEFSCTVVASRGIQDEDQQAPTAVMISPTNLAAAPVNPTIVIRFSELIDTTPLQASLSSGSPMRVTLRTLLPDGSCNTDSEGTSLEGVPILSTEILDSQERTVVSFQPSVQLPGRSCVTVFITPDLRDLSGRSAVPAQFQFITEDAAPVNITLREQFTTPANQDALVSGGVWSNGARPGSIGGDGRHGSFRPDLTPDFSGTTYTWNTGSFTIPASNTPSGQEFLVTDGRFFFTDFVLPENVTLRFVGTEFPQIYVRGQVDIRGTIDISAVNMPMHSSNAGTLVALGATLSSYDARTNQLTTPPSPNSPGQPGGIPGPGGGRGGKGAKECAGGGPETQSLPGGVLVNLNDGEKGEDLRLRAGHAYAPQAAGTGGAGGPLHPALGTVASAATPVISVFRSSYSRGGGGGAFMQAGRITSAITVSGTGVTSSSAASVPAVAFPLLPYPATPPTGYSSLNHFLIGGSGGGGGGSHPYGVQNTVTALNEVFLAGHAGTGGGGGLALRAGNTVLVASTALIRARGGDGGVITADSPSTLTTHDGTSGSPGYGYSSPGGGGSGGSILLQSARVMTVNGALDTTGGLASRPGPAQLSTLTATQPTPANGSHGFYRLEAEGGVTFTAQAATVPAFVQADNVGPMLDRDDASGDVSKWASAGTFFPPLWLRYELDVDTDGDGVVDITYTDSGEPGTQKANDPAGPVTIRFQGARLNQAGNAPLEGLVTAWYEGIGSGAGPGIGESPTVQATGYRFEMLYNRAAFPNLVVRELRVFARS